MRNDESRAVFNSSPCTLTSNSSLCTLHSSLSLRPGCGYRLRGGGRAGRSLRRAGRLGLRVERGLLPSLLEVGDRLLHLFFEVVAERLLLADGVEYAGVRRFDEAQEVGLEASHVLDGDVVNLSARRGPDDEHLLLDLHRLVLRLRPNLGQALAARELRLRRAVEV